MVAFVCNRDLTCAFFFFLGRRNSSSRHRCRFHTEGTHHGFCPCGRSRPLSSWCPNAGHYWR